VVSGDRQPLELEVDVRRERRQRRRRLLRIVVPVAIVLVMVAALASIGAYLYRANRADAQALADDLLAALDRRIATEVQAYLRPASTMIELVSDVLERGTFAEHSRVLAEPLALNILRRYPQLASFLFADPQGNFMMLKKQPGGPIDTKYVDRSGGAPRVTWVRRNPEGEVVATEVDPDDRYDPRDRPWYQGAVGTGELYWSDVYVFFTDREPGVTVALPVFAEDGTLLSVFGVDMQLEALSRFLADLEIGATGRAMIIDEDGTLVAYPDAERMMREKDGELVPAGIEELGDPTLTRAFDRFRVEGHGRRELSVGGERYISTASPLRAAFGRAWTVLIVVPEADFLGFVVKNNRTGLALSAVVIGLAAVLAALLAAQGLRADRNARLVLARQHQLEAQSRAFSELAAQASLFEHGDDSGLATLSEIVARTLGVRRVSVWALQAGGELLVCEDCFDRESGGHTQGTELDRDDVPALLGAIAAGEVLAASRAADDPRTAALHALYLEPMGCRAIVSLPIVQGEGGVGALWLEDEALPVAPGSEAFAFCRAVANLLALRRRVASETPPPQAQLARARTEPPPAPSARRELARPMRETDVSSRARAGAFLAELDRARQEGRAIGAQILEDVTVLSLTVADSVALAGSADGDRGVLDQLVDELEQTASRHGLEYFKLLGDRVTCAAGSDDTVQGAHAVADFAIEAQAMLRQLFTRLERSPAFAIGIDSGPAMGALVGGNGAVFNLWGQAVSTAEWMAQSGVAGSIQLTESSYRRLRDDYLFRVRGTYYIEGLGELTTYVLAGRV